MISIKRIDHFVLTVKDVAAACDFYSKVLGMKVEQFKENRYALIFGNQKINLHPIENDILPKAVFPAPGSADFCLITNTSLEDFISHLKGCNVKIVEGPIKTSGAKSAMMSVYFRDPDNNLVEVANYL